MFTRTSTPFFHCALLLVLFVHAGEAAAQSDSYGRLMQSVRSSVVEAVAAPSARAFVPVRVERIGGPEQAVAGETVAFAALTNAPKATLPLRSEWDFGDGEKASGLFASHRYARPGTYPVVFRLWNTRSEDADTLRVTVLPARHAEWRSGPAPE